MKYIKRNSAKLFKPIKVAQKGKLFELLISRIESAIGFDESISIYPNKYIENIDGFKRQIDVYIESKINGYPIGIAVECKEYKIPIDVDKVECFACKCQRIPTINKKIFVSQKGYTKQAVSAAKIYGIELINLDEINKDKIFDWTKPLKFYIQKRFIRINEVKIQKIDLFMNLFEDIDNYKIKFEGYGKEITLREFCTSYLINLSFSEWRYNFNGKILTEPVGCGYIVKPEAKMLILNDKEEFESILLIFTAEIFENRIMLEKTAQKTYKSFELDQSKAKILQMRGEIDGEIADVEIIARDENDYLQINYSLIRDKQIICSESDTYYLKDILKN